jgi:hypothetical protein
MRFNEDPATWVGVLSDQRARASRAAQALEQLCKPGRDDLSSTMRMALALMAIRDAEAQRSSSRCDFSDLLSAGGPTTPAAPPTP